MNEAIDAITSEDDADALLNDIEQPVDESAVEPGATREPAQDPNQPNLDEIAFTVGGKEVKSSWSKDRDKILRWAQQGYEAPKTIGELNKQLQSWKEKETTLKQLEERYGTVDKYVRENPQWWEHVQSQYEKLQTEMNPNNPLLSEISTLKKDLEDLKSYKNQVVMSQEDKAYQSEIENIKKQYPKIDLDTPDESGKSLEYKVLEHAQQNGIKKFTTAFRDFYHDELLKLKEEEAKEKVLSDKQSKSKLGILGISSTPTRRVSDSVKGKSYGDLEREALEELGIAR